MGFQCKGAGSLACASGEYCSITQHSPIGVSPPAYGLHGTSVQPTYKLPFGSLEHCQVDTQHLRSSFVVRIGVSNVQTDLLRLGELRSEKVRLPAAPYVH
jgi:hypothetical protein